MRMKLFAFLALVILSLSSVHFARPTAALARTRADDAYLFVEVETTVTREGVETSGENPEERRWYISSVMVEPTDVPSYSLVKQKFIPYFNHNVVEPAQKRGIAIDYYDQDLRVNGETSYADYATKAEAEQERNKAIEYRKGQGGNIYSFEISFDSPKGEATSKPKLIYRDKEQPNYEK